MQKLTALACLAAMLALVPASMAQERTHSVFNVGLGAQFWSPKELDDFMDEDAMWGGNLIIRIRPVQYFGIDLRAGASSAWSSETYRYYGETMDEDLTLGCVPLELGGVLMLPLGDTLTLYGGGGVGYYYYRCKWEVSYNVHHHRNWDIDEDVDMEDDVGWYALAGATIRLCPHLSIFLEGRYTGTETSLSHPEDYDVSDEENSFDMSGVGIQAGLMFDF